VDGGQGALMVGDFGHQARRRSTCRSGHPRHRDSDRHAELLRAPRAPTDSDLSSMYCSNERPNSLACPTRTCSKHSPA